MRTLLRHTRTGLYFQGPNQWTEHAQAAYDFRFTDRALRYVATWELTEVELAFSFEDSPGITSASLANNPAQYVTT